MELIVTLLLLMIIVSMGISAYSGIFSQHELVQRTERLYHFLTFAKSQSIKLNKKVYVHFCQRPDTEKWEMVMAEQADCNCFSRSYCLVNGLAQSEELVNGKTIFTSGLDIKFSGKQASYSPMRFSVNPGSITLSDINDRKLKVIQSTMRLRICSPVQAMLGYEKC